MVTGRVSDLVEQGCRLSVELKVIGLALFLNIVLEESEIAVLTHGIDVVAYCPEVATPQESFKLGVDFE